MTILIDSHTFLWFVTDNPKLSQLAKKLIEAEDNRVLLSIASLWEITIKSSLGKLPLNRPIAELIRVDIEANEIEFLPVDKRHVEFLSKLPHHHRDPFDRLIAAQALSEQLTLLSADEIFDTYGVQRVW